MQWSNVPRVPGLAGVKLFWERVTFSRLTKIYFFFSVLHCIVQLIFQAQAFVANAQAATFLYGLVMQGGATDPGFAVYDGELRMCETVPNTVNAHACSLVWDGQTKATPSFASGENYAMMSATAAADHAPSSAIASASASSAGASVVSSASASASGSATSAPASSTASASSARFSSSTRLSSATSFTTTTVTEAPSSTTAVGSSTFVNPDATRTLTVTLRVANPSATNHPGDDDDDGEESDDESDDDDDVGSDSDSESDDEEEEEEVDEEEEQLEAIVKAQEAAAKPAKSLHIRRRLPRYPRSPVQKAPQVALSLDGNATVNLNGLNGVYEVELSRKCLYTLNWPVDNVENTKREDIAFIAFQIWLLGMSLVALLNESIPHVVASLLTHILATAWGGFQIYNTEVFHRKFSTLTTNGACGINLLPSYWKSRSNAEIPSLALNCFALLVSAFLSWRLMKSFGWQTFKRVGASRVINRVYNLVLVLSIAIQLALFFVGASAALWLDQVYNGNIGRLTMKPTFFRAVMITVLVLLIPWLSTGWISVRRELRVPMVVFLGTALLLLAGWASMFIAPTFRWTYATWLFFSLMTTAAVLLTLTTLILGVVCRVNFGKGLTRYLNAQEELPDDDFRSPGVKGAAAEEKVAFPPAELPIPTFSVAFGGAGGQDVPPPSQMRFAPRQMGPRFYSSSQGSYGSQGGNPFDTPLDGTTLRSGPGSDIATHTELSRQNSRDSQRSQSSVQSSSSQKSGRRWVIE